MANFKVCYDWMIVNEDSLLAYETVSDNGGKAISGINSKVFPIQFAIIDSIHPNSLGLKN